MTKNVPNNQELYDRVIAEAKKKFDVYPSAYANGWVVQEYKRRGGTYRVEKAQDVDSDMSHYAAILRQMRLGHYVSLLRRVRSHESNDQ
jgi:hypothetical protein